MQGSESEWLRNAQKGDSQAFTCLVETYERPVYNLCYRMLGNAQDAEDAAQETFLRAYKSLKRYDPERPFSTWLLSIAAHYCIDQIRKRKVNLVSIEELPIPDLPESSPGIETSLGRKEEQARIRSVLGILDPTDRAAIVMYYWYDFSYEEICQALSLTTSALKSRMHRSRRAMAEEWLRGQSQMVANQGSLSASTSSQWAVERMTT
jgi:RNA polymerase sigma-70 factor (ECF subfamily)